MIAATPAGHSAGTAAWRSIIREHALGSAASIEVPDDLEIVRAVLAGNREAFRPLVDRESAAVVRICYRVLGDAHEAEDVAQETFVTAYRSLASWRGDGPFGAWLARIAMRLAIRHAGRRKAVAWARPIAEITGDPLGAVEASAGIGPEQAALRAERATATRRALASLDEPYREVVALRFFGERSLEEIAILTGRPLNTVKTHLRRGLLRLREGLETGGIA
jgi:RNA polymerase sigma-70 factor (ECF subfamily)